MSGPAERLLDEMERGGSTPGMEERLLALVREHPDSLPAVMEGVLRRQLSWTSFLINAVNHLPASTLGPLAELAVRLYAPDEKRSDQWAGRSAPEELLSRVAFQFPRLLHPWLTELFEKRVNFDMPHGDHPWRESGERHHAYLLNVVRSGGSGEQAARALKCLLETRTPAAFRAAERHEELLMGGSPLMRPWAGIDNHLPDVGYERVQAAPVGGPRRVAASLLGRLRRSAGARWRRLYPEASYHLGFPVGYLPEYMVGKLDHPTFRLVAEDAATARFGGAGSAECRVCGQQAHHLLTLDPVPGGLGVTSVPVLVLETCFRCIWEGAELWWKHDGAGRPAPHPAQSGDPRYAMDLVAARETTVRLVPTPARWYWQDAADDRQNLTRLGGYPCWLQSTAFPACPDCDQTMTFLFQLDAGFPGDDGDTFGDGLLYTYWCDACRVSISAPQGT